MIKLYKIPDKFVFAAIFTLLVLWNLKYFFLIFQIPFTMLFVPYIEKNSFYSQVKDIKTSLESVKDFQDEGKAGFVSDVLQASVFDLENSIRDFYITQYAIIPSVLKNDTEETYVIGVFEKNPQTPKGFEKVKEINKNTYLYKRIEK